MKIQIDPKYQSMVPPMPEEDYQELKNDIKKNGVYFPITLNPDGIIIDGHHRFRVCQELDLNCPSTTKHFKSEVEEELFIIDANLKRRHLSIFQRLTLLDAKAEILKAQAAKIQEKGKKYDDLGQILSQGRVADQIAKEANVSNMTVKMYHKVKKHANKKQLELLNKGDIKINKVYLEIQNDEKRKAARKEAKNSDDKKLLGDGRYTLYNGDISEMGARIKDNSVDLIFTDPPYLGETIDVYSSLANLAVRVLKPGGSLVTIVGHHYMMKINEMITNARYWKEDPESHIKSSSFLTYWWPIVLKHGGHTRRVHAYFVWAHYKPMLWYCKGEKPIIYHDVMDLVESEPVDKARHEWEQSTKEAESVIRSLTVENQIVLDPFMGSGTTGEAALKMGRKFIGIEIEKEHFNMSYGRLLKTERIQVKPNVV